MKPNLLLVLLLPVCLALLGCPLVPGSTSPTPAPSATETPAPDPAATATPDPAVTATPTPTATASPTPDPATTATPTPSATASPTPEPGIAQVVTVKLGYRSFQFYFQGGSSTFTLGQSITVTPYSVWNASGWRWYVDNVLVSTKSSLIYTPGTPGMYHLSVTANLEGTIYSGETYFKVKQ